MFLIYFLLISGVVLILAFVHDHNISRSVSKKNTKFLEKYPEETKTKHFNKNGYSCTITMRKNYRFEGKREFLDEKEVVSRADIGKLLDSLLKPVPIHTIFCSLNNKDFYTKDFRHWELTDWDFKNIDDAFDSEIRIRDNASNKPIFEDELKRRGFK